MDMNQNTLRPGLTPLLLLVLLGCLLFAATAPAATTTTLRRTPTYLKPATNGHRFLFVVDISSGMKSLDAANRQALFDMIFTGLDGQMRTGDSFGLWLFHDELRAGEFPMQVWVETNALESASFAAKFLREQKYSGKSRPGLMVPRLVSLIKNVRDVNVILLSNGETPIEGTPFDTNITGVIERRKADQRKDGKPFVTSLVARGGEFVSGSVVLAGEPFALPERPVVALAVTPGTNHVAATNALAAAPVKPAAPATPPKKVMQIVTKTNSAPAHNLATTPASVVQPSPALAAAPQPPPPVTPLPSLFSDPMPVAARELPLPSDAVRVAPSAAEQTPATPVPVAPAVISAPASPTATLFLVIGGSLLAGCLALLFLVLRRGRREPAVSFISQSMGRD